MQVYQNHIHMDDNPAWGARQLSSQLQLPILLVKGGR